MTPSNNAEFINPINSGLISDLESRVCDFCAELSGRRETIFARLYSGILESRIVLRSSGFAALPTIGQIFTGSLLVLPEEHVETLALLPKNRRTELVNFVTRLCMTLGKDGHIALFEHGARAQTGGSCGIYHAHLHIVPLPRSASLDEVLPAGFVQVVNLESALDALHQSAQYLLFAMAEDCGFVDLTNGNNNYPSQFFRRRLGELMMPEVSWDWRSVQAVEPAVMQTVELLRRAHVP